MVRGADKVKRWDVYDIADELADVPWMIDAAQRGQFDPGEIRETVEALTLRLWSASKRGGITYPAELDGPTYIYRGGLDADPAPLAAHRCFGRGMAYGLGLSLVFWLLTLAGLILVL